MPIGTIVNFAAVLAGSAVGAVAGARFPERLRDTVMAVLGLLVAAIGIRETIETDHFILVLAAVLLGAVIGEVLRIEEGLQSMGSALQRRFAPPPPADGDPRSFGRGGGNGRFAEGFVVATLVFCIGPLAIIGSIEDGLGNPDLLLAKAALDGFASIAFASAYGWGVAASALPVLVLQGGIAIAAQGLDGILTEPMLDALGAAGGILLMGIALRLLSLKQVRVANMLPAVALAPLFVRLWG